jgi:UDP-3-O-[3-hydroxymyristoyl] glucosamine N-acyltransferase
LKKWIKNRFKNRFKRKRSYLKMKAKQSYTLQELADLTKTELEGNPEAVINAVADLESAALDAISFLANPRYTSQMRSSSAGAIVLEKNVERPAGRNYLLSNNPSNTFQALIELFAKDLPPLSGFSGIHPTAVVHQTAEVASGVTIAPHAVVDRDVVIGEGSFIGNFVSLSPGVIIGKECVIHSHVTIREGCILKDRVVVQPGAVIGSCGFGFTTDIKGVHTKLRQLGNVIIHNDVEIGANTTIDRARFQSTIIGEGTKIDNLVQIAHGVVIGKHSLIIAQTGIAGSTQIGNHVVLAGKVAVNGHIKIADQVVVAACSGISKSILKPGRYAGVPVMTLSEHNRTSVLLRNIRTYVDQLQELRAVVAKLDSSYMIDNQPLSEEREDNTLTS